MRIHFFTAPFWLLSFGSRFRVQGSRFKVQGSGLSWRLRRLFLKWYSRIVNLPLEGKVPRRGNAIKLRKSLAT